jgi:hypothetical protein
MLGRIHILVYFAGKGECGIPLFRVRRSHNIPCLLQQLCDKYVSAIQEDRTWKNYLFGETEYVLLSLVAKSVLAWQRFRWDSSRLINYKKAPNVLNKPFFQ